MYDRDVGRLMLDKPEQPLKPSLPIDRTLVGIVTDAIEQPAKALLPIDVMVVEMTMSPLQHALDGVALSTQPTVTMLHEYFTPEYTPTAMLAGTCSLVVVPVLQGATKAVPKASPPIKVTDGGRLMLDKPVQPLKPSMPTDWTLVGIVTDVIKQPEKALLPIDVMAVEMTMSPLQHALDGVALSTQPSASTLHEFFTLEYTLTAKLAGTTSLAVVPVLQGASEVLPKAYLPIYKSDVGRMILVRLVQRSNVLPPIDVTLVGILMLKRLVQM